MWSQKEGLSKTKHFLWVISCFISQLFIMILYMCEMITKASDAPFYCVVTFLLSIGKILKNI